MLRVLRKQAGARVPYGLASSFCRPLSDSNGAVEGPSASVSIGISLVESKLSTANSSSLLRRWTIGSTTFSTYWLKSDCMTNTSLTPNAHLFWIKSHTYSSVAKKEEEDVTAATSEPSPKSLEDFQHEEIVGPTVERDTSPVADELRKTHVEMREAIQKFTKALLAVGAVHLIWGGMMFRVMDSPFSHALMTEVCASALVLFGLAYYSKQSLKPIEFFTRLEERSRLQILTLSLQITKTMSSFFQRGYGVSLLLFLVLSANLLGCLKLFFSF